MSPPLRLPAATASSQVAAAAEESEGWDGNQRESPGRSLMVDDEELFEHISKLRKDKTDLTTDKARGPVFRLVKYPILLVIVVFVFLELLGYIAIRLVVSSWEGFRTLLWSRHRRATARSKEEAPNHEAWRSAASLLDQVEGKTSLLDTREEVALDTLTRHLRYHIDAGAIRNLVDDLQVACVPDRSGFDGGEIKYILTPTPLHCSALLTPTPTALFTPTPL